MNKGLYDKPEIIPMYFTLEELEHMSACLGACLDDCMQAGGETLGTHNMVTDLINDKLAYEYTLQNKDKAHVRRTLTDAFNRYFPTYQSVNHR